MSRSWKNGRYCEIWLVNYERYLKMKHFACTETSDFKLRDVKIFHWTLCLQGKSFLRKFQAILEKLKTLLKTWGGVHPSSTYRRLIYEHYNQILYTDLYENLYIATFPSGEPNCSFKKGNIKKFLYLFFKTITPSKSENLTLRYYEFNTWNIDLFGRRWIKVKFFSIGNHFSMNATDIEGLIVPT